MKQKLLQAMALFAIGCFVFPVCGSTFSDDFNRSDSPVVGNGWANASGNPPGKTLVVAGNRLSAVEESGFCGIHRTFPFTQQIELRAVFTDKNGYGCLRLAHGVSYGIKYDDGAPNSGYRVTFSRSDQNYNNSRIALQDNGVEVASATPSFQFGYAVTIDYLRFDPDGSVFGRISGDGATFEFSFGARVISSSGSDMCIHVGSADNRCGSQTQSTVDSFQVFQTRFPITIIPTNRTPAAPEITPPVVFPGPYPQQLKTFTNGALTTNVPPDPNRMTIVLTHGWNSSPEAWATNMASEISPNVAGSPNILIWDWRNAAASDACDSGQFVAAARQTPDQGFALGQALLSKLGPTYSNRIHFIGHSLGALVNGHAAIWVHNRGFAPTNTHMTLFDEAEVGTDLGCVELLKTVLFNQWNPFAPRPYYYRPLPPKFGWADNYITAFGLLHPDAHNVILTNGFPANAARLSDLKSQLTDFHGYPCAWYAETVITDVSGMGHRWSFEQNGFAGAPSTNTVFLQSFNGSQWNLAQTNYAGGSNYLAGRFLKYRDALAYAITHRAPNTVQANGAVTGEMLATGPANAFDLFIISLLTRPGAAPAPQFRRLGKQPRDAGDGDGNVGAYAWLPLPIPADAVSMSFDFKIEGNWQNDSLAAALNGTNVLLLAASQVETNVTLNSGLVDVTPYAGRTNEFFVGIIGGTSTNALLTVQNVVFYTAAPPSLQAEVSGNGLKVSWPLTAQSFTLESTTNLATTNAWTTVTNVPAVVDLQNAVTNPISGGARFYRLKK